MNLPRIRGWLLVYLVALGYVTLHSTALTAASIVIYADPSVAGLHSFVPLSALLFYVITNSALILYGIILLVLMWQRRRSAIVNNVVFAVLSIASLTAWHFLGEKSNFGTLVDSAPNLIGAAYILRSARVRDTFIVGPRRSPAEEG
jgi:hypothetical protein